jgi:hypothetical protein
MSDGGRFELLLTGCRRFFCGSQPSALLQADSDFGD